MVGQCERVQDRAGAKGGRADQGRPPGVLQGAGDDLSRAGSALVDQDHHRDGGRNPAWLDRNEFRHPLGVLFLEHRTALQELAGDPFGFAQQAARVVAQVKDQPGSPLRLEAFQGGFEVIGCPA